MTARRISCFSLVFKIVYIAFLLTPGSAKVICVKGGNCPEAKACYNHCVFFGFKDYGGLCTTDGQNLCCCISDDAAGPSPP
ncbi:hypothetical protein AAZX31_09G147900 [Glycine max]|uniref:Knottin scorpion toxin-like domain-containing protein n=1 Tax=Glycine max TaxID=3847 RepID=A0A368ULY6_SOYBN|nr:hypothetical protein GLYMA_09G163500v4 [Glycine max]KAG4388378.1 hypothetical protein GLYMA_09G163500v4 [Glycine max]KAG4388379.1 hypothetical protein GLYMA_09G163500v4 [Glycine max]KAG5007426.1 hypothetical protein JHK85_025968 [Glycine max]KAG5013198.1 hypothetical protein JHK86_025459 [Glycine max]